MVKYKVREMVEMRLWRALKAKVRDLYFFKGEVEAIDGF